MYHWFLLLSLPRHVTAERRAGEALKFFETFDDDRTLTGSLSNPERSRLAWLGAVEFAPVLSGGIGASYVESFALQGSFVGTGLILCVILCWLLREKTPLTRLYSSESRSTSESPGTHSSIG